MREEVRVYVARGQEEAVEVVRRVLERVRPEHRPKLKVVRVKVRAGDFPWYLEYLEELFGGIATAEYRRYGIRSLPAVVYKGKTVIQGKVPSQEELAFLLACEGLRVRLSRSLKYLSLRAQRDACAPWRLSSPGVDNRGHQRGGGDNSVLLDMDDGDLPPRGGEAQAHAPRGGA